ncbi:hypothetical protein GCM10023189_00600 [Nibrella saemangeumensis]|uniref:Trypsin-like peptidase domain-containing protein n=1 Tax=Nibrella saemangeumensis TaxID=1084526 RepID=A0ABP8MA17_9BACT
MESEDDKQIEDALRLYGNRIAFRNKLNHIHAGLDMEAVREESAPKAPIRLIWRTYRTTLAVAASVAVFTTFVTLLLYKSYQTSHKQEEQYSMLRRDLQAIKRSQSAILNDIDGRRRVLQQNPGQVAGTGFLLTSDGYMVTNKHIIQGADSVYVQSQKGEVYKAKLVYTDPLYDLAVLQLRDDTAFRAMPPLPYSFEAHQSDLGERVFTLGYPREEIVYGEGYLSSGTGYRGDSTAYQVSISVNPGNSGGPLLDEKGNVIGIITGKQVTSDGASFAIKSNYLYKVLESIPGDSLKGSPVNLNRKNSLVKLSRKQQIKKMQDYVYMVKVFKHMP